VGEFL